MKNTPDQAAVTAVAAAAFLAYNPSHGTEIDVRFLDAIVEDQIGLEGFVHDLPNDEAVNAAVWAFACGLNFGLQVGARIGADPLHIPNVKDLIAAYHFQQKRKAA